MLVVAVAVLILNLTFGSDVNGMLSVPNKTECEVSNEKTEKTEE